MSYGMRVQPASASVFALRITSVCGSGIAIGSDALGSMLTTYLPSGESERGTRIGAIFGISFISAAACCPAVIVATPFCAYLVGESSGRSR